MLDQVFAIPANDQVAVFLLFVVDVLATNEKTVRFGMRRRLGLVERSADAVRAIEVRVIGLDKESKPLRREYSQSP